MIDIRPSPRILAVLGDIEFREWQCVAELVDNAFDDFLDIQRTGQPWPDGFRASVTVPTQSASVAEAEVIVQDTGRGMDLETLNDAVRAGWSSNDRFTKLGLFGIGFNIATARLGRVARVLTTRPGDGEWVGVEIDLQAIAESEEFSAPVITETKTNLNDHGTRVTVSHLKPAHATWLQRNQAQLRNVLGDVYAYLLEQEQFRLTVNGVNVKPRLACRWDETRKVTYGSGRNAQQIAAVINIDNPLPEMETCLNCRNWQASGLGHCAECGDERLVARPRRVHGWLGIQRYLHKTDFGIDFLRNGRKILRQDKRIFDWQNPNDPLAAVDIEYPTELRQGGRIIGEIHLDHVPVNYQKNAFEYDDRSWIAAIHALRGTGPLLPQKAKAQGYPPNESPLGQLHKAFRRNDPGLRYLIPGNGRGPIHDEAYRWGQRFHEGDPDYQADGEWYEAAKFHDEQQAASKQGGVPDPGSTSALEELDLAQPGDDSNDTRPGRGQTAPGDGKVETEVERLDRYRAHARSLPELTGDFGLVELGGAVKLKSYLVSGQRLEDDRGYESPVLITREPNNTFAAFVDSDHAVFRDFDTEAHDLVLVELAHQLKVRTEHEMSLSQAAALLKLRHLGDRKIDLAVLGAQARELLREVRERMAAQVAENPPRAWQFLEADERTATENRIVQEGGSVTLAAAQEDGSFLLYAPPMFVPRLLEEWPEAFMDGTVFGAPYADIANRPGRRVSVGKVAGYLYDVALLADAHTAPPKDELIRARLSLSLLRGELAPDA